MAKNIGDKAKAAAHDAKKAVVKVKDTAVSSANKAIDAITDINITPEELVYKASQLPIAKVDRSTFLRKELKKHYPEETVQLAIKFNPAYAGVDKYTINKIANQVIQYETNKVSSISFAAFVLSNVKYPVSSEFFKSSFAVLFVFAFPAKTI